MNPPVAAVLFDLDDTLLVDLACIEQVLQETCAAVADVVAGLDPVALAASVRHHAKARKQESPYLGFCEQVGIASWEILAADFSADAPLHDALRVWAVVFRGQVWGGALADHGVRDATLTLEAAASYSKRRRQAYRLFPDALPCLDVLDGAGIPWAIVTNGPADLQHEKVDRTGLTGRARAVVVSGELGIGKPDPLPLRLALDRLGVPAAAAVMVGDSRHRDIAAAHAAGVGAVWLARPDHPVGDGPDGAATITGLDGLAAVLGLDQPGDTSPDRSSHT